jgi:hypothetical protein
VIYTWPNAYSYIWNSDSSFPFGILLVESYGGIVVSVKKSFMCNGHSFEVNTELLS